MKLAFLGVACLIVFPTPRSLAAETGPVLIRDTETVVFYGDSITEQNLYTAYLETFLISRFPHKKIKFFNFGWGGDTAAGGLERFARDAAPVRPTLVFVNYGMNDGGYRAYVRKVFLDYIDAERKLAAAIRGTGAREVLFTASPTDELVRGDKGEYNKTLSRLGRGVTALGNELNQPVIDLFQPMLGILRSTRARDPKLSLIPDAVHPNAAGHLLMAYIALRRIDAPRVVGEIELSGGRLVKAGGAAVERFSSGDGLVEFYLSLPFLPFYVPPEARPALELAPFEEELNRFRLRMEADGDRPWNMSVDGVTVSSFPAARLRDGIDLALLDKAPWAVDGLKLWKAAQLRWQKHFEAWRRMGIDESAGTLPDQPSRGNLARAQRAYADELGASLSGLAQPRPYHVRLWRAGPRVAIKSVELSPAYPRGSFDKAYPPETGQGNVRWKTVPFENGRIDLGGHFNGQTNIVSYSRVSLQADKAVPLHLTMGSDDGLAVILNGKRVFSHDIRRPLRAGEDETEVQLLPGRNELLFMVTQGVGGYALSVEAEVMGMAAEVRQL
jgi:lysophospholipase L1-like esterase